MRGEPLVADAPTRKPSAPELTIREACQWLDPPITEGQLTSLLRVARVGPVGKRRAGRRGRPEYTYDAAEIMRLHSAILEWL